MEFIHSLGLQPKDCKNGVSGMLIPEKQHAAQMMQHLVQAALVQDKAISGTYLWEWAWQDNKKLMGTVKEMGFKKAVCLLTHGSIMFCLHHSKNKAYLNGTGIESETVIKVLPLCDRQSFCNFFPSSVLFPHFI